VLSLLLLAWLVPSQPAVPQARPKLPIDAATIEVGVPVGVTEIDTGKLKGEVRRLAWAPDGATLYLQTAEGTPPLETLHHYSIAVAGGALTRLDEEPDWAAHFWTIKQDRVAPGLESLVIQVVQGTETIKSGTGPAGVLDRQAGATTVIGAGPSVENLGTGTMGNERARVVRLTLQGENVATWVNERPIPGMRFSWGPTGSGALVYVGDKGQLVFLDRAKKRHSVAAVKDAVLPAWSLDGTRITCLQKTGRKKYMIVWMPVGWQDSH
jgi:hypothetical protein